MKKLLGISLVAVLAVSPLMANAAIPAGESGLASNAENVAIAGAGKYYAGKAISDADRAATASAAYVKGAYNDAISAVNKVAEDANNTYQLKSDSTVTAEQAEAHTSLTAGTGVAANLASVAGVAEGAAATVANYASDLAGKQNVSDSTVTTEQAAAHSLLTAGTGVAANLVSVADSAEGSASAITTLNGTVGTSGSVLNTVKLNAAGADYNNTTSGIQATTIQDAVDNVEGRVDQLETANANLGNTYATKTGVENTIETATITANVASQGVTGYVPVMVNWGDSTADTTTAVALAGGATAGGQISGVSISATYAEPVVQGNN